MKFGIAVCLCAVATLGAGAQAATTTVTVVHAAPPPVVHVAPPPIVQVAPPPAIHLAPPTSVHVMPTAMQPKTVTTMPAPGLQPHLAVTSPTSAGSIHPMAPSAAPPPVVTHAVPTRRPDGAQYVYRGVPRPVFVVHPYHWPKGLSYVHYDKHQVLPRDCWRPQYWIYNYAAYGLDEPAPDKRWVRYGPDLLLVDFRSGEIAEVVRGAFREDPNTPDFNSNG